MQAPHEIRGHHESPFEHADEQEVAVLVVLRDLVADRRRHPGNPEQDVLTRLIQGESSEHSADVLSETELLQNCIFLLNAGHETTTTLIGNALLSLLEHSDQKASLMADLQAAQPHGACFVGTRHQVEWRGADESLAIGHLSVSGG